jgi:hypothetical protein
MEERKIRRPRIRVRLQFHDIDFMPVLCRTNFGITSNNSVRVALALELK